MMGGLIEDRDGECGRREKSARQVWEWDCGIGLRVWKEDSSSEAIMEAWRRIPLLTLILSLLYAASYSQDRSYHVKRVVDGDTLLLTNGERVRLIGVDTPEVHESKKFHHDAERTGRHIKTIRALGKKASAFTKSLVDRKEIKLEYDQANAHLGHRNKFGRILAYVHLAPRDNIVLG